MSAHALHEVETTHNPEQIINVWDVTLIVRCAKPTDEGLQSGSINKFTVY
jgi:hypothetical protein